MSTAPRLARPPDHKGRDVVARDATESDAADQWRLVEFRPARWLVVSLTLLAVWLVRPALGKRALVGLAWRFTPRRVRLIAGGVAALALVVVAGSIAALVLVLGQLA
jgi:hypothetical protein